MKAKEVNVARGSLNLFGTLENVETGEVFHFDGTIDLNGDLEVADYSAWQKQDRFHDDLLAAGMRVKTMTDVIVGMDFSEFDHKKEEPMNCRGAYDVGFYGVIKKGKTIHLRCDSRGTESMAYWYVFDV